MEKRSMRSALNEVYARLRQKVRWFTRLLILATFLFVMVNASRPEIVEPLRHLFGFAKPSLAAMIAVMILLFLLERVFF